VHCFKSGTRAPCPCLTRHQLWISPGRMYREGPQFMKRRASVRAELIVKRCSASVCFCPDQYSWLYARKSKRFGRRYGESEWSYHCEARLQAGSFRSLRGLDVSNQGHKNLDLFGCRGKREPEGTTTTSISPSSIANRSAWMLNITRPDLDSAAILPETDAAAPSADSLMRLSARSKGEATWRSRFHDRVRAIPASS